MFFCFYGEFFAFILASFFLHSINELIFSNRNKKDLVNV